jgi:hypothetical protein
MSSGSPPPFGQPPLPTFPGGDWFVARRPFEDVESPGGRSVAAPYLPVTVTTSPRDTQFRRPQHWKYDTGFGRQAISTQAELDASFNLWASPIGPAPHYAPRFPAPPTYDPDRILPWNGTSAPFRTIGVADPRLLHFFRATLWLMGNGPQFGRRLVPFDLSGCGLAVPEINDGSTGLIGRALFYNQGIRVMLESPLGKSSISVWLPDELLATATDYTPIESTSNSA